MHHYFHDFSSFHTFQCDIWPALDLNINFETINNEIPASHDTKQHSKVATNWNILFLTSETLKKLTRNVESILIAMIRKWRGGD